MSALRDWLLGVVAAAMAVALAQALTPEGAVKRIGRLAGGLVLLLAVVKPVGDLAAGRLTLPGLALPTLGTEEAGQAGEEVMKSLIAQKVGAYIVDKGRELGLSCEATVTVAEGASDWPVPWEAEIRGSWSEEQRQALSRAVEEELDIPAQRQSFREEGT